MGATARFIQEKIWLQLRIEALALRRPVSAQGLAGGVLAATG